MQFYIYRIEREHRHRMVKGHLPYWSSKRNWDSSNACSWKSSMNNSDTTVPNANKHKQWINATNMCIRNAKSKRRGDSGIFGAKITEFEVVVGKIWGFEVWRAIL
jgi:hypothetical protein